MSDKMDDLLGKVEQALDLLDKVKMENRSLRDENRSIKQQLAKMRKEHDRVARGNGDKNERVRTRLVTILNRIDQLEKMTG